REPAIAGPGGPHRAGGAIAWRFAIRAIAFGAFRWSRRLGFRRHKPAAELLDVVRFVTNAKLPVFIDHHQLTGSFQGIRGIRLVPLRNRISAGQFADDGPGWKLVLLE